MSKEQFDVTETNDILTVKETIDMLERILRVSPRLIKVSERGMGKCICDQLKLRNLPEFETYE